MTFDVPGGVPHHRARIEAVFEPSRAARRLDVPDSRYGDAHRVADSRDRSSAGAQRRQAQPASTARRRSSDRARRSRAVRDRIERVAATDFTILIEGESGTGKELVARQIHELSRRHKGPFVAVNCAAIVETLLEAELFGIEERTATGVRGRRGKFEHAHEGTLFLDEVADLSPAAQAKLLRAIQDLAGRACRRRRFPPCRHAHHRRDQPARLRVSWSSGRFRLDLYYRLHGVEVQVPPLRARREDIAELARYFLERHRFVRHLQLSKAAADALLVYDWPGNVRELERVIERGVALAGSDSLELDDLPPRCWAATPTSWCRRCRPGRRCGRGHSRYARLVYERCNNNKRQACRELGISYHTLRAHLAFRPERAQR